MIVIEDLVTVLWRLPVSKRNLRTYHLPDSSKVVRMTSALMVLIIQSAAPFPRDVGTEASEAVDGTGLMRQALEDSNVLWSTLLKKWSTPKQVDAGETRATIDHFVQDLLAMLNVPEYPAASLLLQVRIAQCCLSSLLILVKIRVCLTTILVCPGRHRQMLTFVMTLIATAITL